MSTRAERFHILFEGARRSHGTYSVEDPRADSPKKEIKRTARTLREPVTTELWVQHLEGTRPLGVVTIREDHTVLWAAVDVDDYSVSHTELVSKLAAHDVPALVCRTKSGGAHVFLFFSEPIAAEEAMSRLRELAALLGHGNSEIYPKQDRVLADKGDLGSWLNMPYFDGDATTRYCVRPDGAGLTADAFLTAAEARRITRDQLMALRLRPTVEEFNQGPPCLETLAAVGFGEGTRNNGLFALGVLAKKMSPDDWEKLLERWNQDYMRPPLPSAEVSVILRSLRRKDYTYRCTDQPCVSHCNVALCRTRPHGVGAGGAAPILESASVLSSDPPLFFVVLKTGGTIECTAAELLDSKKFQLAALNQLRIVTPLYKTDDWLRSVQKIIENATVIEVPSEVGVRGRFEEILENFCTDRHRADQRDEILLGKPWVDDAGRRVVFRLMDLEAAMARVRFDDYGRAKITARLREMGGGSLQFDARGKNVRCWFIPTSAVSWQTSPHAVPDPSDTPL